MKKSPLVSSLTVIDGIGSKALSNRREKKAFEEYEYAIFVGSMTKSGKMTEKERVLIIISFFINSLRDNRVGIKFAIKYKGRMPFVYFETLRRKTKGTRILQQGKTIRKKEKWGYVI